MDKQSKVEEKVKGIAVEELNMGYALKMLEFLQN